MFSLKQDRRKKFLFALRTTLPIILLTTLLVAVIFLERRPLLYNVIILLFGVFASVYYIYYMFFSDIREKIVDEITGTFNRKYLLQLLPKHLGDFIILVSIDNIQEINKRYGFENGDKVLKKFALLLDRFFWERYGVEVEIGRIKSGDFLVILPKSEEEVKKCVEELLALYDNSFLDNIEIKLFATYIKIEERDPKKVIDHLYEELYYCKRCQKDLNHYSNKPTKAKQLESSVTEAIHNRRIALLFQPLFSVKHNRYDLVEIIVKLLDEDGEIIHPSQFIPIVNRLGLENEFDLVYTETILKTIKEQHLPLHVRYSYNLSPFSVRNRVFSERFFSLFERNEVPKDRFVLKLFENTIYKDIKFYNFVLQRYKSDGFLIAFDNFGACNASVEYIKTIDADYVIFDKLFTKRINEAKIYHLLNAWLDAFRKLGIKSVIKFIDDTQKIELFQNLACDYIQGYAIVEPMEAEELRAFYQKEKHALR